MIIDTLVVVVCLMADAPRIQRVEQVPVRVEVRHQPCNRFKRSFELSDSLFRVTSKESMKEALQKTRLERERVLGLISAEEYRFLKAAECELLEMKELSKSTKP